MEPQCCIKLKGTAQRDFQHLPLFVQNCFWHQINDSLIFNKLETTSILPIDRDTGVRVTFTKRHANAGDLPPNTIGYSDAAEVYDVIFEDFPS